MNQGYIDLLKNTLLHAYWEEVEGIPLNRMATGNRIKYKLALVLYRLALRAGIRLSYTSKNAWPTYAFTMISRERMENLESCIKDIYDNDVSGAIIECGVWRRGACIFTQGVMKVLDFHRRLYVADTFDGFPPARVEQDRKAHRR